MANGRKRVVLPKPLRFSLPDVYEQSEVIWEDFICGKALRTTLVFLLMAVGVLIWKFGSLPPEVPLFYSRPWGESQLTNPWGLFVLPGMTLLILVVNGFLGGVMFAQNKLVARMLVVMAALTGFLTTFALIKILFLVL